MKFWNLVPIGAVSAIFPQAAMAEVILSPRVSYYFDNVNQRASGLEGAAEPGADQLAEANRDLQNLYGPTASLTVDPQSVGVNNDQISLPMYGLALTVLDGGWSFTLTGMYGEAERQVRAGGLFIQTFSVFGQTATDVGAFSGNGTQDAERLDLELTAQKRINERFAVMGGVRYERVDAVLETSIDLALSNNANNLVLDLFGLGPEFEIIRETANQRADATYEVFSVRSGVAGFIPFGEGNTVFLNGMLHLSHEPSPNLIVVQEDITSGQMVTTETSPRSETTLGPDMAVGVQLSLAENVSLDIRYRGAFYFPVSGGRSFEDPRVNHGVNAGVSFLF